MKWCPVCKEMFAPGRKDQVYCQRKRPRCRNVARGQRRPTMRVDRRTIALRKARQSRQAARKDVESTLQRPSGGKRLDRMHKLILKIFKAETRRSRRYRVIENRGEDELSAVRIQQSEGGADGAHADGGLPLGGVRDPGLPL